MGWLLDKCILHQIGLFPQMAGHNILGHLSRVLSIKKQENVRPWLKGAGAPLEIPVSSYIPQTSTSTGNKVSTTISQTRATKTTSSKTLSPSTWTMVTTTLQKLSTHSSRWTPCLIQIL